jgi:hypothetical protein
MLSFSRASRASDVAFPRHHDQTPKQGRLAQLVRAPALQAPNNRYVLMFSMGYAGVIVSKRSLLGWVGTDYATEYAIRARDHQKKCWKILSLSYRPLSLLSSASFALRVFTSF